MAARRNRRTRRRNRGRFGFLYKLMSVLIIFAAILLGCLVFFRVNTVVVSGTGRYTQEEVVQAAGIRTGDNLFGLNKLRIYHRVLTALPYVDEISASRKLPDTLLIQITESSPVAVLEYGGEWWLLDARCKLLERGDTSLASGRAVLTGMDALTPTVGMLLETEEGQQEKLESLKALLTAIQQRGMTGSVTSFIDLTADSEIRFGYGANLTVVMPMNDDFTARTYALKRVLETMDEKGITRSGTLDLTYGDGEARLLPERWLPGGSTGDSQAEQTQEEGIEDAEDTTAE